MNNNSSKAALLHMYTGYIWKDNNTKYWKNYRTKALVFLGQQLSDLELSAGFAA